MAIHEANREHQRTVEEELHRAEVQRKAIAVQAGVPLSPVRSLPPAPPQPAWFHPQFQQSFVQPQSFQTSEQPQSSSGAHQGVAVSSSSGWADATYGLASYFFDPAFDTLFPASGPSDFGNQDTDGTQEDDNVADDK